MKFYKNILIDHNSKKYLYTNIYTNTIYNFWALLELEIIRIYYFISKNIVKSILMGLYLGIIPKVILNVVDLICAFKYVN